MHFDLSTLNSEQLKPVLDTEGAVLVTAGHLDFYFPCSLRAPFAQIHRIFSRI